MTILDSPGGDVDAAAQLARTVKRAGITGMGVIRDCASACVMIYAVGQRRYIAPGGRIGVHAISSVGIETAAALKASVQLARDFADLGVPAAIVGRMIATPPAGVAWLTADELRAWDVVTVGEAGR